MTDPLYEPGCRVLDGRCNCKWPEGVAVPPMCKYVGPDFHKDNTKDIECQATFKQYCQWPKCDCDRVAKCVENI
jgi:hypothetical protein